MARFDDMSEREKAADARETIRDARATVAEDTLLSAEFKATADEGLRRILAGIDENTIPVDRALSLAASLMQAVLVQRRHAEFVSKTNSAAKAFAALA